MKQRKLKISEKPKISWGNLSDEYFELFSHSETTLLGINGNWKKLLKGPLY